MFFNLEKKETKYISVEIKKKNKMAIVSLSKVCKSKNICDVIKIHKNLQNPLWKLIVFSNHHLKFAKMKKKKKKKSKNEHFWHPVNSQPNLSTNWSLKLLAMKTWFPFNAAKMLQGRHFVVAVPKKLQTCTRYFFWYWLSKNYIVEFTVAFVRLLFKLI